jgi:hypothetical protein
MAIVATTPPDASSVGPGIMVLVYSDAQDDRSAIAEVEAWCATRGFVRTDEHFVYHVRHGGREVRYGRCYLAEEW